MMNHKNSPWSPWIWVICVIILISTAFIVPLYGGLAKLFNIAVSEGIDFGANEPVRYIAEKLLAPQIHLWAIAVLIMSFGTGVAIIEVYGLSPAFPWQAERFRRVSNRGAWFCVLLGLFAPLAQMVYSTGFASVGLTLRTLADNNQIPVLTMLLFLPIIVAISTLIAYFTGLSFRTHIGVRWMLPFWLKGTAVIIFANVKYIDPSLGSAGSVLAAILKRLKEEA